MGTAAQNFLSMIMKDIMPTDQRAKVEQDFGFAGDIMDRVFPEEEKVKPRSELEYWLKEHPGKGVEDYWKAKEGPGKGIDLEKFEKWVEDSGFVMKGGSVNPVTGNYNINFGLEPDGKKTLDQAISEAKGWLENNPGMEISNINFTTGTVSVGQKGKPETDGGRPNIQKFLFGDTGIISDYIKGLIDDGMPLEEEDKDSVIANYKLRKHTLTEAEVKEVELFFDQIDIDPYRITPPEVTLPGGPQSAPKGAITKFGENIKSNILGIKGLFKGEKEEKDEYGYLLNEIRVVNGKKYQYKGNDEWQPL